MEPNADGLAGIADVASEAFPEAPLVDEALAALAPNGHADGIIGGDSFDLRHMLQALQAMRVGDFSVRLPADRTGLAGKIADTFNEIVAANERMAHRTRACRPGGRPRRQDPPAREVRPVERRLGRDGGLGQHADRRSAVADDRGDARDHRGGPGRSAADRAARCRRPAAARANSCVGHDRQHDDRAAQRVHLGGDPRRARGRHRRQARRPGAGARGDRRVEGPDRERQLDGAQPDRAGAQHRRRHDRRRERRSVEEDHRRRARRDPAAQGSHQHDGRSAALVRLGGDARRARGRHRRQARRPGGGARRRRAPGRT